MRIGIFGGSFDPVHLGHLELAACCQQQAALDEVWFTPTAVQPLKRQGPVTSDTHRLAMLERALHPAPPAATRSEPSGNRSWKVCRLEIDRGGFSYTVETLRTVRAERPGDELFFLIGADALRDIPRWKEPGEIFRLATPLVVRRAEQPEPELAALASLCAAEHRPQGVEMPAVDASSTEVRRRVAAGQPIDHLVPPAVADYIHAQGVYR